jgi:hypothetical protein
LSYGAQTTYVVTVTLVEPPDAKFFAVTVQVLLPAGYDWIRDTFPSLATVPPPPIIVPDEQLLLTIRVLSALIVFVLLADSMWVPPTKPVLPCGP